MKQALNLKCVLALYCGLALTGPGALASDSTAVEPGHELANDYCRSIVDAAAEARVQRQKTELDAMRAEISEKLERAKVQTETLQEWVERRESMVAVATKELVKIYGSIEVEAAAKQLEKLDAKTSAAILTRLNAKRAGEILSVMEVAVAARLVKLLARDSFDSLDKKS
jgi:flagellar motility protein MotE (MotC chaperone)